MYKQITLNRTFNENFIFRINLDVYNFVIYKYSLSILGCVINIAIKSPRSFFFSLYANILYTRNILWTNKHWNKSLAEVRKYMYDI